MYRADRNKGFHTGINDLYDNRMLENPVFGPINIKLNQNKIIFVEDFVKIIYEENEKNETESVQNETPEQRNSKRGPIFLGLINGIFTIFSDEMSAYFHPKSRNFCVRISCKIIIIFLPEHAFKIAKKEN